MPIEFYKVFWLDIKDFLLNAIQFIYHSGELSIAQRQGILTLLPKKEKDPLFLKKWRPISLLNTDYKLISKCIAYRLRKVLPSIIDKDQTGFLKNRFIGENIMRILEIMEHTDMENLDALAVFIDFEKAFDYLEWKFVRSVLHFFILGNLFAIGQAPYIIILLPKLQIMDGQRSLSHCPEE